MTKVPAHPSPYTTQPQKCDVKDTRKLIAYRKKRQEWLSWYNLDQTEPHSIEQQIFSMIFMDMAYRVLSKARGATAGEATVAASAGLLAHFIDQGYVATQVLAIRRLLDKRSDVISVRRLLDDITIHKHLISREIYVSYDGTPYDSDSWKLLPQKPEMQIWGIEAPGLGNYLRSQYRHEKFDLLSGTPAAQRNRKDMVKDFVFDRLKLWLQSVPAENVVTLSHKFLAHAANVNSRGSLAFSGVSLSEISEIQRAIIRVARAITDDLLYVGIARNVVPMPPLGLLKGLELPYARVDAIAEMHEYWQKLAEDRDRWIDGIAAELHA